ncbi:ABC transporter permease [Halorussus halophilus]|uniref:ABC transporter permease n=1 Tax=Halorussus halophilus TaxID=2650975 RepID=UPI0013017C79|nr:ABC transporter permease subunit [Halorussus halophilus]
MSFADHVPAARFTLPASALAVGVICWWSLVALTSVPAYLLPSPVIVADNLIERHTIYTRNAWVTLRTAVGGGAVGSLFGFLAAVVVVHSSVLRRAVYPYLVAARVLPKIAVAPVLLIYLGTGGATALVFVSLVAFFPVFVASAAGFEETPDSYLDLLDSVDAGPIRTLLFVRVPAALPAVFAGLKQATALSVVGAVVAEWILTDEGLGFLVLVASENVRPAAVLAAVVVLFAEGLALYGLVALLHRQVAWQ